MIRRVASFAAILVAFAGVFASSLQAQPIRLGELNSYKQFPQFLEPYKKGMELAQAEINAADRRVRRVAGSIFTVANSTPGRAACAAGEGLSAAKSAFIIAPDGFHIRPPVLAAVPH